MKTRILNEFMSLWHSLVSGVEPNAVTGMATMAVVLAGVGLNDPRMITDAAILGLVMWNFESRFSRHEVSERADRAAMIATVTKPVDEAKMIFDARTSEQDRLATEVAGMRADLAAAKADMTAGLGRVEREFAELKKSLRR